MKIWYRAAVGGKNILYEEPLKEYLELILSVCSAETSSDPKNWSPDNPLYGHCAVVALLVQEELGGKFMRASLLSVRGYEQMSSHYWNLLRDGGELDLTASQFKNDDRLLVPRGESSKGGVPITRESLLEYEPTRKRYLLLKERFLNKKNKLKEFKLTIDYLYGL